MASCLPEVRCPSTRPTEPKSFPLLINSRLPALSWQTTPPLMLSHGVGMVALLRNEETPLLSGAGAVRSSHSVPLLKVLPRYVLLQSRYVSVWAGPRPCMTLTADRFDLWITAQLHAGRVFTALPESLGASAQPESQIHRRSLGHPSEPGSVRQ